jgi:MFS transporter, MHS family, shikimate and dehydroshikimate transport protein
MENENGRTPRTAAIASLTGGIVEWFDYYVYANASALVLNVVFFPSFDAWAGTMLAFATFAIGAFIRPLGGILFGHYGDRLGRKAMLIWSIAGMGVATLLIGLLPGYASLGIAAPALLLILRAAQGIAFGGEWAGAIILSVEHAPVNRKGFFGVFPQLGSPIGLFLSTGVFAALAYLPKEDFIAWGWRVPFLVGAGITLIGLMLRARLKETPEFAMLEGGGHIARHPIREVFKAHKARVLLGSGAIVATTVTFFVQSVFVVGYATQFAGTTRQTALNAILIAAVVHLILLPVFAVWADRIGASKVGLFGAVLIAAMSYPFFWLVDTGHIMVACAAGIIGPSALFAALPAILAELFEPRLRFSGIALSFGLSGMVSGSTPLIAASLFAWTHATWPISLFALTMAAVSICCLARSLALRSPRALTVAPAVVQHESSTESSIPMSTRLGHRSVHNYL